MRLTLFIRNLEGGGVEKAFVNLANGFIQKGIEVDLVVFDFKGPFKELLSKEIKVFQLSVSKRKFKEYIKHKLSIFLFPDLLFKKIKFKMFYILAKITNNEILRCIIKYNLLSLELIKYIKKRKPDAILSALFFPILLLPL